MFKLDNTLLQLYSASKQKKTIKKLDSEKY
jgi:hypothetical protein